MSVVVIILASCGDNEKLCISDKECPQFVTSSQALSYPLISPLHTGARVLDPEGLMVGRWNGYRIENIGFKSSILLCAEFGLGYDGAIVNTVQKLIRITDDSGKMIKEFITTLVPTPEYYVTHPDSNWEKFRSSDSISDFTGYEIYSTTEEGLVFAAWYYKNGKLQYGTLINEGDPHYRMKCAFIERILRNVSFKQLVNRGTRTERIEYEEVEIIDMGDDEFIKIIWHHIIPKGNSQLDADNPNYNYLSTAAGGRYDPIDYLQKDKVEVVGSTFAKEKVLKAYSNGSSFPLGGYGSSPCFAISLALQYYDKSLTPYDIWIDLDSPDYFYSVFDDHIEAGDLKFLISKYFAYRKVLANNIWGLIDNGKLCVTVSRTGDSQCFYKCMLIVGYTQDRDLIYLDPVTGVIKCRPNDCLDDYTFVIDYAL